jgi:phage tail-like protein
MSAVGQRDDPAVAYNFLVRLVPGGDAAGGFSECGGLGMTLEVEDYREGGRNDAVLHFPTRATWDRIRLRRGIATSDELWNWHIEFVEGRGRRRDGMILLRDDLQQTVKAWSFTRGLPVRWVGPALDAARTAVAIEELEIAHEGLRLVEGA